MFRSPTETRTTSDRDNEGYEELIKTLEKSRKRNISPSLLWGDQAVDRLAAQESSASPLLKKHKHLIQPASLSPAPASRDSPEAMAMTMKDFDEYMRRAGLLEVKHTIDRIDSAVTANSKTLAKHEATIKANAEGIDLLKEEVRKLQTKPTSPSPKHLLPSAESTRSLRDYDNARRSARLWPITGTSRAQLWQAVNQFLAVTLQLGQQVSKQMIEDITRVDIPSGPGVKLKALVKFRDTETRDLVFGAAGKLASYVEDGKPTAGIQMEVPAALRPAFATLFKYGQLLRTRHGQGTRRHVKFEDVERTLYLNVKLPGETSWTKISTDLARRGLRAKESVSSAELEARMDVTGPASQQLQRPRAASTNSAPQPMITDSVWTGRQTGSVAE